MPQPAEVSRRTSAVATADDGKAELHELVNAAVKKLLETQEANTDDIVAQVVEQLKPAIATVPKPSTLVAHPPVEPAVPSAIGKHIGVPSCVTKPAPCVYNPTPIAELKKRHIPVYMPTRETKVAVKRKSSVDSAKPWPSTMRGESTNFKLNEMTYKPTAISSTTQDADSSKTYVPTLRSDNSSSNSYDDGNSNDYVPKAKEGYYPKPKKRREEYVPKKVKAPLKSVQHLEESALDDFEPEFDMIDEILTSSEAGHEIDAIDETTQDLYDIEPKFSEGEDEEDNDDVKEVEESRRTKLGMIDEGVDAMENEGVAKIEENRTSKSRSKKSSSVKSDRLDDKSSNKDRSRSDAGEKSRGDSAVDESTTDERSEKNNDQEKNRGVSSKSSSRRDGERSEKKDRRAERSHDKSRKDGGESKAKSKNTTSTRDKHRSSSSSKTSDRNRSKDSHSSDSKRESSHRSGKDAPKSHKDKVPSSKSDDGKSRSSKSRHERHSSSSSRSRTDKKRESSKNLEKHGSRSSSHRSSGSGKKRSSQKESSSEGSLLETDDHSSSPFESNFVDEELMQTSDSDHDVEEECLKIFQVR